MAGYHLRRAILWSVSLFLSVSPGWTGVYKDAAGREVALETPPRRIISLAPNLTEILFALGLGERVVGVTTFCTYPEEAKAKPKVGGFMDLNVEKVISLAPDLVIAATDGNNPSSVDLLEKAGIKVFLVNPRDVAQAIETMETLGRVCGVEEEGKRLASELKRRVDFIREKVGSTKRARVFLQINNRPIMTVNRHTFHNDLIQLAGGINIFEDEVVTYPRVGIEDVLARNPEVILISSMEKGGGGSRRHERSGSNGTFSPPSEREESI
jgi:cobalamin transport system substrate-binding protein